MEMGKRALCSLLTAHRTLLRPETRLNAGLCAQTGRNGLLPPRAFSAPNARRRYSETLAQTVDVIVCDPRLLFKPFGDPLDPAFSESAIGPFPVPKHLLESGALSSPMEELDSYQPINSFYFGERSEEVGFLLLLPSPFPLFSSSFPSFPVCRPLSNPNPAPIAVRI